MSDTWSRPADCGRPRLVVLSGPSGVGKSSVVTEVRRQCPELFFSVSVTTRPPRPGERDGVHYHFVNDATFDRMLADNQLLEHAEYAANRYGTPRAPLEQALAANRPALLEVELQGARQVKSAMPDALLVMLAPPSWSELVGRLTGRGTEHDEVVQTRLQVARAELAAADEFDVTIVNDDVQESAAWLVALLVGRERPHGCDRAGPKPQEYSSDDQHRADLQ